MSGIPETLRAAAQKMRSPQGAAVLDARILEDAAREIESLRKCLSDTREEICRGPVGDVLWHSGVPACTTVDNITITLGDGWNYDAWMNGEDPTA